MSEQQPESGGSNIPSTDDAASTTGLGPMSDQQAGGAGGADAGENEGAAYSLNPENDDRPSTGGSGEAGGGAFPNP